ncbi:hypothetical protein [Thermospira aquatica]|uniref:Uncharacterized protein n=1 Tax=Thermospira aquatica TaxID=2828656 RepID=A0AAX3BE18_9SPIR|nr:hypothetical protein [Thermospira aquatica]URA10517.1 hypothetical protein KDW03_01565 [Thermospira aquatica]
MRIEGLGSPPYLPDKQAPTPQEKQAIETKIAEVKQELKNEAQENLEKQARKQEAEKLLRMNEYYIKELLFIFSSKGNAETIEKLARLLKKQKEMLSR